MSPIVNHAKQSGRSRVMIVDPELQFGLKLADCLATSGYAAVLVRDLESTLGQLREIQPDAILLSHDSGDQPRSSSADGTLRAVNALCPQAPVLTLTYTHHSARTDVTRLISAPPADSIAHPGHRVEDILRSMLGIPCVRVG